MNEALSETEKQLETITSRQKQFCKLKELLSRQGTTSVLLYGPSAAGKSFVLSEVLEQHQLYSSNQFDSILELDANRPSKVADVFHLIAEHFGLQQKSHIRRYLENIEHKVLIVVKNYEAMFKNHAKDAIALIKLPYFCPQLALVTTTRMNCLKLILNSELRNSGYCPSTISFPKYTEKEVEEILQKKFPRTRKPNLIQKHQIWIFLLHTLVRS